jgi:hypothetical protein
MDDDVSMMQVQLELNAYMIGLAGCMFDVSNLSDELDIDGIRNSWKEGFEEFNAQLIGYVE